MGNETTYMGRSAEERRLRNAECARQSRKRKQDELDTLHAEVATLKRRLVEVEHQNLSLMKVVQAGYSTTDTQPLAMVTQPPAVAAITTTTPELYTTIPLPLNGVSVADMVLDGSGRMVSGSAES